MISVQLEFSCAVKSASPMRVTLSCEEMNIDESGTVEIPLFISIAVYRLLLSTRMSDEVQGSLVGFWFKSLKSAGSISSV